MALRNIRGEKEDVLRKISKDVKAMTPKLQILIDDMLETMYDACGVGLAAPQVGVLRKIAIVDISEEGNDPIIMVNPEIIESSGEQTDDEGCLSVPGKSGTVTRPDYVKIRAFDRNMVPFEKEGTQMLARAICHEIDHLHGILYLDKIEGELREAEMKEE